MNSYSLLAQSNTPVEGREFKSLNVSPRNINSQSNNATESNQIILYCWLGSPSCYQVEHALSQWVKQTNFVLINQPLIRRPDWRRLAKARLVSRQLNQEQAFSAAAYELLHLKKQLLDDDEAVIALAEQAGLSKTRFTNLFYAVETNQAINQIQQEASRLPIKGVPTIIIKQRWLIDASMHKTSRSLLNTLNYLMTRDD